MILFFMNEHSLPVWMVSKSPIFDDVDRGHVRHEMW